MENKLKEENKERWACYAGGKGDLRCAFEEVNDDIEKHPDYEYTIQSTIETAQKELKEENEKLKEENKKLTRSQFDYGIFKSEKYNMEKMLNELHSEKNKLKEENEKLKHTMRHTKGGEYCWSDSGSSSEEDDD
tara:strand:+ start:45 stop:446 length:402 start_codon:yes stop_codon:yes gene_type:complete